MQLHIIALMDTSMTGLHTQTSTSRDQSRHEVLAVRSLIRQSYVFKDKIIQEPQEGQSKKAVFGRRMTLGNRHPFSQSDQSVPQSQTLRSEQPTHLLQSCSRQETVGRRQEKGSHSTEHWNFHFNSQKTNFVQHTEHVQKEK